MNDIDRILELAGIPKAPTIVSASTGKDGGINRKTADRMVDPKGYFQKNKDKNFGGKTINEMPSFLLMLNKIIETKKSVTPVPSKLKGSERRHKLLLAAKDGIRLNVEGGQGYDRDMRRLVADGLAKLERAGREDAHGYKSSNHKITKLVLTDKGRDYLSSIENNHEKTSIAESVGNHLEDVRKELKRQYWMPTVQNENLEIWNHMDDKDGESGTYVLHLSPTGIDYIDYKTPLNSIFNRTLHTYGEFLHHLNTIMDDDITPEGMEKGTAMLKNIANQLRNKNKTDDGDDIDDIDPYA